MYKMSMKYKAIFFILLLYELFVLLDLKLDMKVAVPYAMYIGKDSGRELLTDKGCILTNIEDPPIWAGYWSRSTFYCPARASRDPFKVSFITFYYWKPYLRSCVEAVPSLFLYPGAPKDRNIPQMMDDTKGKYCFVQGGELGGNKNMRKAINKSFFNFLAACALLVARGSLLVGSVIPRDRPLSRLYLLSFYQ